MENFIITASYLTIGIILRLTRKLPKDFSNSLNLFVIYVSLPALILLKVPRMDMGSGFWFTTLLPWLMVVFNACFIMLISRLLNWSREVTGCLLLMTALGNTSFLGIPMVRAFFGSSGIPYAIIYDQLGSFLALSIYGSMILALYAGGKKVSSSPVAIATRIVTFPPFIALVCSFALRGSSIPAPVTSFLSTLGSTLVPVVMIAVGYQLRLRLEPGTTTPMMLGLVTKLCISPIVSLFIAKILGLHGESVKVAIFESGMPPMVSAGALAIMANLSTKLTAALVGGGIFVSFLTLPVLFKLIGIFIQ